MEFSNRYIVTFALILCLVCALVVSSLAVGLKEPQQVNALLFKQQNVLRAAGVLDEDEKATREEVDKYFSEIRNVVIDRRTGATLPDQDANKLDFKKMGKAEATSEETGSKYKYTLVKRVPDMLPAYEVEIEGNECIVLPIRGYGLWSTLYGYIALSSDGTKIVGITYYEHGETAGLGGEVENPSWKAQFPGKIAVDAEGNVKIAVVKSGTIKEPTYQVDGLSGATITSNGVTDMLRLWLGEMGYGPYLATKRQ